MSEAPNIAPAISAAAESDGSPVAAVPGARRSFRIRWCWFALARDERGGPAVEFALAAPILLMTLAAFAVFGMYMLVQVLLESSLRDVARYGITGQAPAEGDFGAAMLRIIEQGTHGLVDTDAVVLTVQSYPTFDDVGRGEDFVDADKSGAYDLGETFKDCNGNGVRDADRGTTGMGASGDVVAYRIDYAWPSDEFWNDWKGMLELVFGTPRKLRVQATTVVRNEPWDADSAGRERRSCAL